jgi:hypothetical protein
MITSHKKIDIAGKQLKMAIQLLVAKQDRFSVITLANSADGILSGLLLSENKETFVDSVRREKRTKTGTPTSRGEVGSAILEAIRANQLKHFDDDDEDAVTMELEGCAIAAVSVAAVNHSLLLGFQEDYVKAFWYWVRNNLPKEFWEKE